MNNSGIVTDPCDVDSSVALFGPDTVFSWQDEDVQLQKLINIHGNLPLTPTTPSSTDASLQSAYRGIQSNLLDIPRLPPSNTLNLRTHNLSLPVNSISDLRVMQLPKPLDFNNDILLPFSATYALSELNLLFDADPTSCYAQMTTHSQSQRENESVWIKNHHFEVDELLSCPSSSNSMHCISPNPQESSIPPKKKTNSSFLCEYFGCSLSFTHRSAYLEHRRRHTGERPFKCSKPGCRKEYSTNNRLTVHIRTHTGERPFECTHQGCPFKTTQSSNLKKHMLNHLSRVEKGILEALKCWECSTCAKKFETEKGLGHHSLTAHGGRLQYNEK